MSLRHKWDSSPFGSFPPTFSSLSGKCFRIYRSDNTITNRPGVLCSRPSVTNGTWRRSIHSEAFGEPLVISDETELELLKRVKAVLFLLQARSCAEITETVQPNNSHTGFFNSAMVPPSSLINSKCRWIDWTNMFQVQLRLRNSSVS